MHSLLLLVCLFVTGYLFFLFSAEARQAILQQLSPGCVVFHCKLKCLKCFLNFPTPSKNLKKDKEVSNPLFFVESTMRHRIFQVERNKERGGRGKGVLKFWMKQWAKKRFHSPQTLELYLSSFQGFSFSFLHHLSSVQHGERWKFPSLFCVYLLESWYLSRPVSVPIFLSARTHGSRTGFLVVLLVLGTHVTHVTSFGS